MEKNIQFHYQKENGKSEKRHHLFQISRYIFSAYIAEVYLLKSSEDYPPKLSNIKF